MVPYAQKMMSKRYKLEHAIRKNIDQFTMSGKNRFRKNLLEKVFSTRKVDFHNLWKRPKNMFWMKKSEPYF